MKQGSEAAADCTVLSINFEAMSSTLEQFSAHDQ